MAVTSVLVDESGRQYDQIQLVGLSGFGRHGVFDHERETGQMFTADVIAHVDTRVAAAGDDLAHTVDYASLSEAVLAVITGEPVLLIETLAGRIAEVVLARSAVRAVDVVVHKPQAPLTVPVTDVAVSIRRYADGVREDGRASGIRDSARADSAGMPALDETGERLCDPVESVLHSGQVIDRAPDFLTMERPDSLGNTRSPDASLPGRLAGPAPLSTPPDAPVVAMPPVTVPTRPPVAESAAVAPTAIVSAAAPTLAMSGAVPALESSAGQGAPAAGRSGATPHGQVADYVPNPDDPLDRRPDRPVEAILALGANLGQAQQTLREAILELNRTPGIAVARVSPLARTSPVGGPPQPDFLNIVLIVDTSMAARELLHVCQALEIRHGRERTVPNGPRTLDVDVIAYGTMVRSSADLTIPHPRAHVRAFVLAPWAHLDPGAILYGPEGGLVSELAEAAPDQSGVHYMALDWFDESLLDETQGHGGSA